MSFFAHFNLAARRGGASGKIGDAKMALFSLIQFPISLKLGIELAPRRGERQQ